MTAKEIVKEYANGINEYRVYMFTTEQLKAYADALCKEQIESCHLAWTKASRDQNVEAEAILTAPQPEGI